LVGHYFIEEFCITVHSGDWPAVPLLDVSLSGMGMSIILASYNELGSVPDLSTSWKSLRSVGICSSLKVW
jgi:hypothetical protein